MTEITLKIDLEELRDIYWGNGYQRYFFGPATKKESAWLVFSILVYPFFAWYSIRLEDYIWFVFGTVFFVLLVYRFVDVARPIIAWKKSVIDFLNRSEQIKVLKLLYTDEYIIHREDEKDVKMNWSAITHASINDRYISFEQERNYFLIPRKSLTAAEFAALSEMLLKNVPIVEKTTG